MSQTVLQRGVALLRGAQRFDEAVIAQLARHLTEAPEEALFRMNPLSFAKEHALSERVAIDLFLYATHVGLMEFSWGVLCAYCNGFLTTPGALKSLQRSRQCTLCSCAVQTEDDNLEVTFTVSPSVRRLRFHSPDSLEFARDGMRLIFSPSAVMREDVFDEIKQNVIASGRIKAGEVGRFELQLEPGYYPLVVPAHHAWLHVLVEPGASSDPVEVDLVDGQMVPTRVSVGPGTVELRLRNRTQQGVMVGMTRAVDRAKMKDSVTLRPYLSGKKLVTTQLFRELFRTESVPADAGLEFKSLTVLFTDLKGSTELYERVGDFRAYALVREHFDLLRQIIDQCGGAMVKTIGDAIMASFADVEPAMAAATRMRDEISRVGQGELSLKVGLHTGPCIAVELNEQLDYFGQTVNVAARVQNLAGGGEIVCTDPVWRAMGVQERITGANLRATQDRAQLKGVEGDVTVYRLKAA